MFFIDINIFAEEIKFEIYMIENQKKEHILQDKLIIPKSFAIGRKLSYVRSIIKTLIRQYNVKYAQIIVDDIDNIKLIELVKIEGIIEELFSSSGVDICK